MRIERLRSIFMEDLSWTEIKNAIEIGYDTILVGFGAMEQHGPHLPIQTDTFTARRLCELVACSMENVLVSPEIPFGSSIIHRFFPGTITISEDVLFEFVKEYCQCLESHGFKKILLIPTHGGNFKTAERITEYFSTSSNTIKSAFTGGEFITFLRSLSQDVKISQRIAGTHSGEMETSIYAYLSQDLSVLNGAEEGFCGDYDSVRSEGLRLGMKYISPNGIIGDATQASYGNGKYYVNRIVEFMIEKTRGA